MMACYETCVDVGKRCSLSKHKIHCIRCGGLKPHYNLFTEHTAARPGGGQNKRADKETRVVRKEELFDKREEFFPYLRYKECKCKQSCWQWILSFLGFGAKLPECCKRVQLSVWDSGDVARAALASKFQAVVQRIGNRCKPQVRRTSQINLQELQKGSGKPPTGVGDSADEHGSLPAFKEDVDSGSYLSYVDTRLVELESLPTKVKRIRTGRWGSSSTSRSSAGSTDKRKSRLLSAIASLKARSKPPPSSSSSGSQITEERDLKVKSFFNPFKNRSFVRTCSCHKRFQALYCPQLPCARRRRSKSIAPLSRSKEAPGSAKQRVRVQSSSEDQRPKQHRSGKQPQPLDRCVVASDTRSPSSSRKHPQPPCQTSDTSPSFSSKHSNPPCQTSGKSSTSSHKTCQPPCQTTDRSPSTPKKHPQPPCQTSDTSPSSSRKHPQPPCQTSDTSPSFSSKHSNPPCQTSDKSPTSSQKTCQPPCQTTDRSPSSSKKHSQPPCQTSDKSPTSSQKTCQSPCQTDRSPSSSRRHPQPPCQTSDISPSSSRRHPQPPCQTSGKSPTSSRKTCQPPCQTSDRSPASSQKPCQPPCQERRGYKVIQSSSMPCTSCFGSTKPFVSRFCRCEPELPCGGPKLPCRSQSFHSTMLRSPSPLAVVMPTSSPCCRPCAVSTGRPRCRRFKCSCPLDCITRRSRSCSRPCCCPIRSSYCSPPPMCKSNRERTSGPYVDKPSPCNLDCCQMGNKPPISICPPCCTKPCCLPCPRKFNVFPYCPRVDATSKRYLSIPPCTMRAACPCPTGGPCTCPKAKHFPLPCCPYTPSATCRVACSTPNAISYIKSKQNDAICQRLLSKYGFSPPLCQNCPLPCYGNVAEGMCGNMTPTCTSNFYSCAGTGSGGCRSCLP